MKETLLLNGIQKKNIAKNRVYNNIFSKVNELFFYIPYNMHVACDVVKDKAIVLYLLMKGIDYKTANNLEK